MDSRLGGTDWTIVTPHNYQASYRLATSEVQVSNYMPFIPLSRNTGHRYKSPIFPGTNTCSAAFLSSIINRGKHKLFQCLTPVIILPSLDVITIDGCARCPWDTAPDPFWPPDIGFRTLLCLKYQVCMVSYNQIFSNSIDNIIDV